MQGSNTYIVTEDDLTLGVYCDGRRFDFRWWAHDAIYRLCIIEMYA